MKMLTARYTFDHKEEIKEKGGLWDPQKKLWAVPDTHFEYLMKLCKKPKIPRNKRVR